MTDSFEENTSSPRVIGVLGGAFDPPHLGHAMMPAYLFARGLVDRVLVAPCADHPFGKSMSPFEDRWTWTRLAMAPYGATVEVTDLERRLYEGHGGPSYTLRLLEAVASMNPEARVRLVVGSDIVATGETRRWHRWDAIEARFQPIVVPRAGHAPPDGCALPDVSSTAVRDWIRQRRRDALATSVPAALLPLLLGERPGKSVWLVGSGHVAAHVEPWLRERGHRPRKLGARTLISASEALPEDPPDAVWILTRDAAIADVARILASDPSVHPQIPVLHAAGALRADDPRALAILRDRGHPIGTLHPICSLRKEGPLAVHLRQAVFGIEGDDAARACALSLIEPNPWLDLQQLDAKRRTAYHAACALAANHVAVLYDAAGGILRAQRHDPDRVDQAMGVLLRSALDNLLRLGIPRGITGPVARGDWATVRAHEAALEPKVAELYRALSGWLREIAARSNSE